MVLRMTMLCLVVALASGCSGFVRWREGNIRSLNAIAARNTAAQRERDPIYQLQQIRHELRKQNRGL